MRRTVMLVVVATLCVVAAGGAALATRNSASASPSDPCQLGNQGGQIKHVIYLQFDNTHYRRDDNNVASDLEQMPHLLSFLKDNGTLFTNDHTILISHTAGGILSTLTGLYPDRQGQTVSNSYGFFRTDGSVGFSSSFKYWTDVVDAAADPLPNMITDGQQTTPAPWLTFTHAGCNVGGVSAANIELENTSTNATGDMTRVFGTGSPEWTEAQADPAGAQADFVGIAIHCALGNALCNSPHAKPDDETIAPGSNNGYEALFGAKYVNPAIGSTTTDASGRPCINATDGTPITDAAGRCGFPGFDGALAKNTLGEVAQMQEHGVPVTFAYISDAHDNHTLARASGPGEADYQAQLKAYDDAFATFFQRLANDGIDKSNTLFAVTVDEGDHFAGGVGTPDPSNPGALAYNHTFCFNVAAGCPSNQIGEVNLNLYSVTGGGPANYSIHNDDAPTFYLVGNPAPGSATVRNMEHTLASANVPDPYAQGGSAGLVVNLADKVEEKTLHMVNADPARTPTFTMFGNDDFFFDSAANGRGNCKTSSTDPGVAECVDYHFAWNHGDIQPEIGNTWVGFVGPGVAQNGVDSDTWTDHVNVRPTILSLVGLHDGYTDDGRVLIEALTTKATPQTLIAHRETLRRLGAIYEQLNAPFGQFATDTLAASTQAIESNDANDATYNTIEGQISGLTAQRDTLAGQIRAGLNAAAFGGQAINEQQAKGWIDQAQSLLDDARSIAGP